MSFERVEMLINCLGIETKNSDNEYRSLKAVIDDLAKIWDDLDNEERNIFR